MSQASFLADQIRRAFDGEAWHGDSALEILADVDAKTAAARPIPGAHSIWELVLHIAAWDDAVTRRTHGTAFMPTDEQNFPAVNDTSESAWQVAVERLKQTHSQLVNTVANFPDARLREQVPGKEPAYYTFHYMFAGVVQHETYHAGQIALLKKAARRS